jgi:cytoskeleton protein RodZ
MNDNAYQETLFAEPLGLQLRHAREKLGLKVGDAAARLKLPSDVIEALELENWGKLGAAIYVRSYLSSYIKLLGLPGSLADEFNIKTSEMPTMKILSEKPVRRDIDKTLSTLGYFAITGVIVASLIMLAMHFQAPNKNSEILPLDLQSQTTPTALPVVDPEVITQAPANDSARVSSNQEPVMAGIAPVSPLPLTNGLEIRINADSWIEITANDGKRIESGIISAGTVKHYAADQLASVTIGNADQVQILRNGQTLDLSAFKQDNVARFKISSDGALVSKTATQ